MMNELLLRRRLLMGGQSKGEYVEYPDAYKLVYVLSAETSIMPFMSQTPTPTKIIVDGMEITPAKTFTLSTGTHTVYYWVNPWAVANNYSGNIESTSAPYLVGLRLPTFTGIDVETAFHNIFMFTVSAELEEITCLSMTPPNFGSGTSRNRALRANTVKKIRVPIEALSDYQAAQYWNAAAVKAKLVGVKFDFGN